MLSMGKDGHSVITKNWSFVARGSSLLDGEIAMFWLQLHEDGLRLNVFNDIPLNTP